MQLEAHLSGGKTLKSHSSFTVKLQHRKSDLTSLNYNSFKDVEIIKIISNQ